MSARRASEAVSRFDEQPVRELMSSVAQRMSPVHPAEPVTLDGVEQLSSALTELFEANDPALLSFQRNFLDRTQVLESPESHRFFGLTGVLEELLLKKPSDKYYYRQLGTASVQADPQFVRNIQESLCEIGKERSYVIADMIRYLAQKEVRMTDFLRAIFRYYAEHEQSFLL